MVAISVPPAPDLHLQVGVLPSEALAQKAARVARAGERRREERALDRLRELVLPGRLHGRGRVRRPRILAEAEARVPGGFGARRWTAETVEGISPPRDPGEQPAPERVVAGRGAGPAQVGEGGAGRIRARDEP